MLGVISPLLDFVLGDFVLAGRQGRNKERTVQDTAQGVIGSLTSELPVTATPQRQYPGSLPGRSVIDDYYEAIHIRPAFIDVGRLTSTVRRQIEVWSAYREQEQLLERIDVTRGTGIIVTGVQAPYTFKRLQSVIFTVDVTPDGPARIDALYRLIFPNATQTPYWQILGTRIIEWYIPPNWGDSFDETLAFRTEVLVAYDGSEQRIALRNQPRRSFSFTPLQQGEGDRSMKRLLTTWQNRAYAMAYWPKPSTCPAGAPAGAINVQLDAPVEDLVPGGIIVFRLGDDSRILEVSAVDGTQVTLTAPLVQPVLPGTRAFLGLNVHADPSLSSRRLTSRVGSLRAQFRELHSPGRATAPAAPFTWRGKEVFRTKPNWARAINATHHWDFDWVDSGRGTFDFKTPVDMPKDTRQLTFTARSREEVDALKAFFVRCRGRRGEFYMPTWDEDIAFPRQTLNVGDLRLPVSSAGDADRLSNERVYRNVAVRLTDGTWLYRQAYAGGDSESGPGILLDQGWPRTIYPEEVVGIHWLPRCRLASDDMTVRWLTDEVAEITLAMQVLPDVEVS